MRKILYVKQADLKDCGVSCLMSLIRYYGGFVTREYLRDITKTTKDGVSAYSLIQAGEKLGFEAKAVKSDTKNIKMNLPVIAHILINQKIGHFVVITKMTDTKITIMDPSCGFRNLTYDEWKGTSTNIYLLYKPKNIILKQENETNFLKILFPIIKKYKSTFLIVFIFSLIYTICNILISYQFQFFLSLLQDDHSKTIHFIFWFLVLVILLKEITNLFRGFLLNYLNHQLDKTLLNEVYDHIIRLPYLYFKNRTKGDIVTRIQDVFTIRDLISKLFVTFAIDLVLVLFTFIILLKLHLKLGIIVLIITLVYIFIIICYNTFITRNMKVMKEKSAMVHNHLIESLSSASTIKGMQLEDMLRDKLKVKYNDYTNTSFYLNKKYYQENFFKEFIYGIGLLIIIYLGILEVLNGSLSLGQLLVINSLIGYYFSPIQGICDLQFLFKEASVSFTRIKELLNIECEKLHDDNKTINKHLNGNIIIHDLHYSYNGIDDILNCKKLEIKASSKVLLYGVSGGGKSTLMKLLARYMDGYDGDILIDNRKLYSYNLLDIRKRITYVSQDEILYTDTVYNNIILNHDIPYQDYLKIIKLTGVDKIIEKSMLKDEMILDNNASNLSGGEKQRIILARTLVKNSDIYIFDEALSALDIKNERILLKNIFHFLKNKTVIVISHRFNNRDLYQRFVLVEKGIVYEY